MAQLCIPFSSGRDETLTRALNHQTEERYPCAPKMSRPPSRRDPARAGRNVDADDRGEGGDGHRASHAAR